MYARILVEDGRAVGVEDEGGTAHHADIVICNAPLPHALDSLLAGAGELDPLRTAVRRRAIFPSVALVFLGLDASYDPGAEYVALSSSFEACTRGSWTAETAPLILVRSSDYDGGVVRPAFIMACLGHDYADRWASGPNGERGRDYVALKEKAARTFIDRFDRRLPKGFREAIRFSVAATPLTLERYTGNAEGSFMGFHCRAGEYGRFLPQTTPIRGLYFAGQWVFPGFGVAGVAASGYYCANTVLEREGVDLKAVLSAGRGRIVRYALGIAAALVAGIAFNVGILIQKAAVGRAPKDRPLMRSLLKSPVWISGFFLQFILGTPLYTLSVGLIGPAIVPGLMSVGLIVLAIGAVRFQKERVKAKEIAGIVLVVLAVTMFGLTRLSIDVLGISMTDPGLLARAGIFSAVLIAIAVGCALVGAKAAARSDSIAALHAARAGMWYNLGNLGLGFITAGLARFASRGVRSGRDRRVLRGGRAHRHGQLVRHRGDPARPRAWPCRGRYSPAERGDAASARGGLFPGVPAVRSGWRISRCSWAPRGPC